MFERFVLPSDEGQYQRNLQKRIRAAWLAGKRDLQSICRRAAGAFPVDVLQAAGVIGLKPEYRDGQGAHIGDAASLPEPLLIDWDWRFDVASARYLAMTASRYGRVLCVGTPTVFLQLIERRVDAVLIDRNSGLAPALGADSEGRVHFLDVREGLPHDLGLFDAVVLDPPWYLAEYRKWLSTVLPALKSQGTAIIVLFPEMTRPTAPREREELLKLFSSIGEVRALRRPAGYITPAFEHTVLAASNLPPMPAWRLAPVIALNARSPQVARREDTKVHCAYRAWKRYQIGGQSIAHEELRNGHQSVTHCPPPGRKGFILDTVSARAFDGASINMITSRNRAGIVQGAAKIAGMLALLQAGYSSAVAIDRISAGNLAEGGALKQFIDDFKLLS